MNTQEEYNGAPCINMDLKLDMDLVEVLADQKEGTEEQQRRLQGIINEIGDNIYRDAIYLLTHEIVNDICEAKEAFEDIKNHQNSMTQSLERTVSLQVAALDYMQNIQKVIKHPTIIDSDKYYQFAYNAFLDETTKIYDKKLLHVDLDNDSIKQKKNILENKRVAIKGVPLAPGLASGVVFYYSGVVFYYKDIKIRDTEIRFIKENEIDSEIRRIKKAIQQVKQELHMLTREARREMGNDMAMIFDAHITLLDDKSLLDEIENVSSTLGLRGVRFLLHHVDLLKTQLRVCLRLSKNFNIKILIPFVTIPEEVSTVRKYLEREKMNLRSHKIKYKDTIQLGAMIETPAAIFNVDEIVERSDFISIGSNDLLQYIMVADRENQKISAYYEKGHCIIVNIIRNIIAACDKKHIQCSLCGELAADKRFTDTLLDYGLKTFSIRPLFIPELKSHIMHFIKSVTKILGG